MSNWMEDLETKGHRVWVSKEGWSGRGTNKRVARSCELGGVRRNSGSPNGSAIRTTAGKLCGKKMYPDGGRMETVKRPRAKVRLALSASRRSSPHVPKITFHSFAAAPSPDGPIEKFIALPLASLRFH